MDYTENEDEQNGVTKWPFYVAALFIISLVLGFAYLHLKVNETLDQWQLTTCILASGLASILVFIPHLIDRFLALAFDPSKRKDEELHRKTYFDIKEMKSQLEAFSVKIDKVPTLVDKIVSDSQKQDPNPDPVLAQIPSDLKGMQNTLLQKIKDLEELIVQTPLLPEPDPAITQMAESIPFIQNSIDSLSNEIKELQKFIKNIPPTETKAISASPASIPENENASVSTTPEPESLTDPDDVSSQDDSDFQSLEVIAKDGEPNEESDNLVIEEPVQEAESIDQEKEFNEPQMEAEPELELTAEPSLDNHEQEVEIDDQEENSATAADSFNDEKTEESSIVNQGEEELIEETSPVEEPIEEELELDLPDPAETLRKVDAILQDTDPSQIIVSEKPDKKKEETSPKKSSTGTTSVVANVMIGIGNKPYLRGEGPGLSWDEGVPMNFIEIGKWAWSPSRKNASLKVQLYRNDNDPDQSGKIDVQAGEKIEITPDFV
tara:strand:+ start:947 stop:2422 length:1476 start_codon:yes stop_codon:yes gene_type:complete